MPLDEAQEVAVLIADPLDRDRSVEGTGHQRVVLRPADGALRIRNRIAVRIDGRASEHFVDPFDQTIRYRVLEMLRFIVDFGPTHPHHLHEEQLNQPVTPEDEGGELLAGGG